MRGVENLWSRPATPVRRRKRPWKTKKPGSRALRPAAKTHTIDQYIVYQIFGAEAYKNAINKFSEMPFFIKMLASFGNSSRRLLFKTIDAAPGQLVSAKESLDEEEARLEKVIEKVQEFRLIMEPFLHLLHEDPASVREEEMEEQAEQQAENPAPVGRLSTVYEQDKEDMEVADEEEAMEEEAEAAVGYPEAAGEVAEGAVGGFQGCQLPPGWRREVSWIPDPSTRRDYLTRYFHEESGERARSWYYLTTRNRKLEMRQQRQR